MNNFIQEELDQGVRFTLLPKKVNFFIKAILFIITLTTIVIPFSVLFSTSFSKAAIVGAILCGFISVFLLRMFLWNVFGKEVFEVGDYKISHYIDYQFFKDELFKTDDTNNISYGFSNLSNMKISGESDVLDIQEDVEKEEFLFLISNNEGELTKSNVKLTYSEVQEMIDRVYQKK